MLATIEWKELVSEIAHHLVQLGWDKIKARAEIQAHLGLDTPIKNMAHLSDGQLLSSLDYLRQLSESKATAIDKLITLSKTTLESHFRVMSDESLYWIDEMDSRTNLSRLDVAQLTHWIDFISKNRW